MDSIDPPPAVLAIIAALALAVIGWATYTVITERDELSWRALAVMAALVTFAVCWAIGLAIHESAADVRDEPRG